VRAAVSAPARNDYANAAFTAALNAGLAHFYARDFEGAANDFSRALSVVGDNTLAIAFLDAAAAQQPGALDTLIGAQEDAVAEAPKEYARRVRLGFSYIFQSDRGLDRMREARDEFEAALGIAPSKPAAHVGLGIIAFNERRAHRAKLELLTALGADSNDVLAREYLGQLYQSDLREPVRGLSYESEIPNLVPGYADIFFHLGSLLWDLGQADAAISYLRRGVALDVGHVGESGQHGYVLIAQIYIRERKLDEAKRALHLAIEGDADALLARKLLSKIERGA
jgi:tetratricopeptide (TPR) repeat protein